MMVKTKYCLAMWTGPLDVTLDYRLNRKSLKGFFVEYVAWDDVKCQSQHARPVAYLCLICVELQAIF